MARDLWPDYISDQEFISPRSILAEQAEALAAKTGEMLRGIVFVETNGDRVDYSFDVVAERIDRTIRLFSASHQAEQEYPIALQPPIDKTPDYLKRKRVVRGLASTGIHGLMEDQVVDNEWVCSTPSEFRSKLKKLLGLDAVSTTVISLLGSVQSASLSDPDPESDPKIG